MRHEVLTPGELHPRQAPCPIPPLSRPFMASAMPITPHIEAIKGPRQALYPPSSGSFMASATPFTPSARPKKASTMPFTPFVEATKGLDLAAIGALAAIYPAVWGLAQLVTGGLSDRIGRKGLIVAGMWVQAVGIGAVMLSSGFAGFATGNVLLGLGTAMVYPTLLAAIGDVAHPSWRASAVGVYRLWRDLGYAIGALVAGLVADAFGLDPAVWLVAAATFAAGVVVLVRMTEQSPR
jgi:MFS family permease